MATLTFSGGEDGRALSFTDYQNLLNQHNRYLQQYAPVNTSWGGNINGPDAQPLSAAELADNKTATEAFWKQYSPEVRADFQKHMADSKEWGDSVLPIMKMIPLAVGGAGLAATGLFGPALQSFVGGAPLGGAGGSVAGAAGLGGEAAGGIAPTWDAATSAAWQSGAGLGGDTLSAMGAGGGGLFSNVAGMGKDALGWLANNRGLVSLASGLASGLASKDSGGGSTKTYPAQPGMKFGTLNHTALPNLQGTMTRQPTMGLQNSGLARFGATGGTYTPPQYNPAIYTWG